MFFNYFSALPCPPCDHDELTDNQANRFAAQAGERSLNVDCDALAPAAASGQQVERTDDIT